MRFCVWCVLLFVFEVSFVDDDDDDDAVCRMIMRLSVLYEIIFRIWYEIDLVLLVTFR